MKLWISGMLQGPSSCATRLDDVRLGSRNADLYFHYPYSEAPQLPSNVQLSTATEDRRLLLTKEQKWEHGK